MEPKDPLAVIVWAMAENLWAFLYALHSEFCKCPSSRATQSHTGAYKADTRAKPENSGLVYYPDSPRLCAHGATMSAEALHCCSVLYEADSGTLIPGPGGKCEICGSGDPRYVIALVVNVFSVLMCLIDSGDHC
ncbi:hypothetical protein ACOMHN_050049 [Nucella lapillus]